MILKFGCASLTGFIYLKRYVRTPDYAVLGGLLLAKWQFPANLETMVRDQEVSLDTVYNEASTVLDIAGLFDKRVLCDACYSLCELVDRQRTHNRLDWASITVHVSALRLLWTKDGQDPDSLKSVVMCGWVSGAPSSAGCGVRASMPSGRTRRLSFSSPRRMPPTRSAVRAASREDRVLRVEAFIDREGSAMQVACGGRSSLTSTAHRPLPSPGTPRNRAGTPARPGGAFWPHPRRHHHSGSRKSPPARACVRGARHAGPDMPDALEGTGE